MLGSWGRYDHDRCWWCLPACWLPKGRHRCKDHRPARAREDNVRSFEPQHLRVVRQTIRPKGTESLPMKKPEAEHCWWDHGLSMVSCSFTILILNFWHVSVCKCRWISSSTTRMWWIWSASGGSTCAEATLPPVSPHPSSWCSELFLDPGAETVPVSMES